MNKFFPWVDSDLQSWKVVAHGLETGQLTDGRYLPRGLKILGWFLYSELEMVVLK